MSTLFDRTIAESYTELLKTASTSGVTSTLTVVEDGDATASALQISTSTVKSSGTLEVVGPATLSSSLAVTGASTLTGNVSMAGDLLVSGNAVIQGTLTANGGTLTLGDADTDNVVFNADVNSHILPNTDNTYDLGSSAKSWRNLFVDSTATVNNLSITGSQAISATTQSTDKDTGALVLEGGLGVEKNANIGGNLGVTGTTSLTGNASLSGTLGVSGATNLSSTLGVAGDVSVNTNKFNITAVSGNTSVAGTLGVTGATTLSSTLAVTGNATMSGNLTVSGDLTVNGTTTNINTTNLVVEDKNVVLADVTTPNNTTADGGGITLKGTTDKTLNWVNATGAWTSSEDFNLLSGKVYEINGASVLSATSLGSGVTGSSLTSVGTIGTGTWQGTIVAGQYGGTGVNNSGKTITLGGNLTTSGAFATTLTSTGATNVTLPTTGTLATLANSETFTNKTLTSPVISSIVNTGTLTLPTSTDTLVGRATTDTLTNKSINLANNTLTATSAQIASAVTDETGTGSLVFSNSPTLVTPTLGAASATSLTLTNALSVANGGTGRTSVGSANTFLGVNSTGTAFENKTLTAGTGISISDVSGTVTITNTGGGGGGGGGGSASGAVAIYRYNATAGQTVFSGADASSPSSTLVYTPNYVNVFLNGVKLDDSDFTATNGTSVTLSTACVLNDDVDIVAFGAVPQLASPGLANYVVGTNSGGTSLEYKQLVAGTGVSIAQGTGSVTISASGASAISAPLAAFRYIASAGQTVFTGIDSNGNTLAFTPGFLYVFVNGVLLAPTLDYTTTGSTTITLVSGCSLSDFVDILAFGQVTTIGIADSNITTAKIADANVTTAKIADANVTTAKIADNSVTEAKLNSALKTSITGKSVAMAIVFGGG